MPYSDPQKRKEYHKKYNKKWYQKAKKRYKRRCPVCLESFTSRYKQQQCCSLKCAGEYRAHTQKCPTCGKTFRCFPSKKQKYCSRECWGIKRYAAGKCKVCGKKMLSPPSRVKTYCSAKCMFDDPIVKKRAKDLYLTSNTPERRRKTIKRLKSWTGSKNPAWKGGITPLSRLTRSSKKYLKWRTKVFERDSYTCVLCGKNKCYVEADHFPVPFAKLLREKSWVTMWDIDNGRTLCKPCHKSLHRKII